jgi:hypothetical protein
MAPYAFGLKLAEYLEKERVQPLQSTTAIFLVFLAHSSSSKRISK